MKITGFLIILELLFTVFSTVLGYETYYKFGEDCSVSLEHVNEDETIIAEYYGEKSLSSWCDDMSFTGRDDDYLNEYEICVTPLVYEDPDCAIEMYYRRTYDGYKIKTYTCSNKPEYFCGKQDDYLYIDINDMRSGSALSNVKVKLKIVGKMTYNYYQMVGIIVGSVIGGLVLVSICIGVCVWVACRQKRSAGQVLGSSSVPMTQQYAPATNSYPTQPPGGFQSNYSTNYSSPMGSAPSAPPSSGYTYNAPPPSYDEVK